MRGSVNIQKASTYSIVINSVQVAAIIAIALLVLLTDLEQQSVLFVEFIICLAAAVVIWGAVVDISQALSAVKINEQTVMLEEAYGQLEALNLTLRAQRHDFMNHLQVVGGLIEMGETAEAGDYIDRLYGDIEAVSSVLRTGNPAVNALLKVKMAESQRRGVHMEVHVNALWNALPAQGWEMCRVLGNLIDNALDALEGASTPMLGITLGEEDARFTFTVENNGPEIPEKIRASVFLSGFTTKGAERGMGLAIVRQILRANGGDLTLSTGPGRTAFSGWLPRAGGVAAVSSNA